jgi:hypothetical protein
MVRDKIGRLVFRVFTGAYLTGNGTDYLKEIWEKKKDELQQLFPDQEIQFKYFPGMSPKIAIKFWDLALKYLVSASTEEKMEFAKSLHSKFSKLVHLVLPNYEI